MTAPGDLDTSKYVNMTSGATPFVAAADARLHEKNPQLSNRERIEMILEKSLGATLEKKEIATSTRKNASGLYLLIHGAIELVFSIFCVFFGTIRI
jgi:hypothetical protein